MQTTKKEARWSYWKGKLFLLLHSDLTFVSVPAESFLTVMAARAAAERSCLLYEELCVCFARRRCVVRCLSEELMGMKGEMRREPASGRFRPPSHLFLSLQLWFPCQLELVFSIHA